MADVENKKYLDEAGLQRLADNRFLAPHPGENGETELTLGAYKVEVDEYGHVTRGVAMTPADIGAAPADSIGDGKLTIKTNGIAKGSFTANQTTNTEINISLADFNITGAMHFRGISTTDPLTEGARYTLTIPCTEIGEGYWNSEHLTVGEDVPNPYSDRYHHHSFYSFSPVVTTANTTIILRGTTLLHTTSAGKAEPCLLFSNQGKVALTAAQLTASGDSGVYTVTVPAGTLIDQLIVSIDSAYSLPENIIISNVTPQDLEAGDVVLYDGKEYVYSGDAGWQEFGNEGDHALKTVKVEGDGTYILEGGDLSQDRKLKHKTYTSADPKIIAVGRDSGGHVVLGDEISVQSGGGSKHSHTVTINVPANTFVTSVDTNTTKIGIEYDQADVVTNIDGAFNKLVTTSINGVSGSTTASKATAGTPKDVATIGAEINYGTADVGDTVTVATRATAATQVASGTITTKKTADSTACAIYTADVDDEVLILSPVTVTLGTKNIYEAAGTAEVTSAVAADTSRKVYAAQANGSITPYTFTDVTVPVAANAVTVATGAATTAGTGATIMTGLGTITTAKVLSDAGLATGLSEGFAVVTSASGTKAAKTISGTTDDHTCPAHTHTLSTQ